MLFNFDSASVFKVLRLSLEYPLACLCECALVPNWWISSSDQLFDLQIKVIWNCRMRLYRPWLSLVFACASGNAATLTLVTYKIEKFQHWQLRIKFSPNFSLFPFGLQTSFNCVLRIAELQLIISTLGHYNEITCFSSTARIKIFLSPCKLIIQINCPHHSFLVHMPTHYCNGDTFHALSIFVLTF